MIGLVQFESRHWDLGSVRVWAWDRVLVKKRYVLSSFIRCCRWFSSASSISPPSCQSFFFVLSPTLFSASSTSLDLNFSTPSITFPFTISVPFLFQLYVVSDWPVERAGRFSAVFRPRGSGKLDETFSARVNPYIRRIIMQRSGNSHYLKVTITQITQDNKVQGVKVKSCTRIDEFVEVQKE